MRLERGIALAFVVAVASSLGGCVAVTTTPGQQGDAYVVRGNMFGTTMYHCESKGGEPKCYQVKEQERGE